MYTLLLSILGLFSLFVGKVFSVDNGFICQCYCSLSEYIIEDSKLKLNSVRYFADIRAQTLELPGKEGVSLFSNSQPSLRVSSDGRYSEYRTGTVALWNSDFNLDRLSSIDKPEGQHSMISMMSSFDDVFLTVNRISKSSLSMSSSPAVMIFKNTSPNKDNDEYRQKYCERVCQRPVSSLKQYSYSKTEFVELSYNGNLFNQYPTRDSIYYPDIQKSIIGNSGKDRCSELASSLTGTETSWKLVFEKIRDEKTEKSLLEKLNNMYPMLNRRVSDPVIIDLTENSRNDYIRSGVTRINSFQKSMKSERNVNIVRFPENLPPVFEQPLSPLFQFRAKLVPRNGVWVVEEIYTGSRTKLAEFPNEYLNLLLTNKELERIVALQNSTVEKWASDYWDAGYAETHVVVPAALDSIEPISRDEGLDSVEQWISSKEHQIRTHSSDVATSLLQLASTSGNGEPNKKGGDSGKDSPVPEDQTVARDQLKAKEIHIIYYGVLTLNCYTQQIGSEIGDVTFSNTVVLNLFPDTLIRRDGNDTFKRILIPKNVKRWTNISNIFDSGNSISNIIKGSSYSFALQLAKYNPQLYLTIFRDLKDIFSYGSDDLFLRNTCKIPGNKHHVETVIETSGTLQSTVNKVFYSDPSSNDVLFNRIKFTDVDHFNLLLTTMTKCLGVLPPTARVRVSEHFKDQHSVVSDYVCAIDEGEKSYLLQLYSKYNID